MLLHVRLNRVVEIFHDALERFGERFLGYSGSLELLRALAQFVNFVGNRSKRLGVPIVDLLGSIISFWFEQCAAFAYKKGGRPWNPHRIRTTGREIQSAHCGICVIVFSVALAVPRPVRVQILSA